MTMVLSLLKMTKLMFCSVFLYNISSECMVLFIYSLHQNTCLRMRWQGWLGETFNVDDTLNYYCWNSFLNSHCTAINVCAFDSSSGAERDFDNTTHTCVFNVCIFSACSVFITHWCFQWYNYAQSNSFGE